MYIIINRLLLFLYDEIHLKKYSYLLFILFFIEEKKKSYLNNVFLRFKTLKSEINVDKNKEIKKARVLIEKIYIIITFQND